MAIKLDFCEATERLGLDGQSRFITEAIHAALNSFLGGSDCEKMREVRRIKNVKVLKK